MLKMYQGRYENGHFILPEHELVLIPDNANIIITVLDDIPSFKSIAQKQREALKRLSDGLKKIDDEPFDEEFDAIMNQRFNIGRELDL